MRFIEIKVCKTINRPVYFDKRVNNYLRLPPLREAPLYELPLLLLREAPPLLYELREELLPLLYELPLL